MFFGLKVDYIYPIGASDIGSPANPAPSFRDGPKDQTRNLERQTRNFEIPGSMLSHRPGMTASG
jgi:hypothetical protein